jgi:hypothetical protein
MMPVQPVQLYALPTGQLSHPDRWIFEDGDDDWMSARQTYPDYSFLIQHQSGKNVLFDLGLTKVSLALMLYLFASILHHYAKTSQFLLLGGFPWVHDIKGA